MTPLGAQRSRLSVGWDLNPRTFWRRALGAEVRHAQLAEEVRTSLTVLGRQLSGDRRTTA